MVIDAAVLTGAGAGMARAGLAEAQTHESENERACRVRRLAELVRGGCYGVRAERLAMALLDWDPRRSSPKGSAETAGRRRTYMRDYMRKRRAGLLAGVPEPRPTAPLL